MSNKHALVRVHLTKRKRMINGHALHKSGWVGSVQSERPNGEMGQSMVKSKTQSKTRRKVSYKERLERIRKVFPRSAAFRRRI
jgi:hypothetical protein